MFKKFSKKIFLSCLIVGFLFLFFLPLINVKASDAWSEMFDTSRACPCAPQNTAEKQYVRMQLNIPGITEKPCQYDKTVYGNNKIGTQKVNCYYVEANLPDFIRKVYNFSIGIIAIFAVMVTMIGGLRWILAGGNPGQIKSAQDSIKAAVSGLVLVLLSYTILNLINPKLTNLELTEPTQTEKVESSVISQCKNLADNTTVIIGNEEVVIKKDSATGENIPTVSAKLADLECETGYPIKDKYYTPNSSSNKLCYGEKCDKGMCVESITGGFQCIDFRWAGAIKGNPSVHQVTLKYVCSDSSVPVYMQSDSNTTLDNTKNKSFYRILSTEGSKILKKPDCTTGEAKFLLEISVDRGALEFNDLFCIDKNCQLIKSPNGGEDKCEKIDWKEIYKTDRLLTWSELTTNNNGHICDIMIDSSFIDR